MTAHREELIPLDKLLLDPNNFRFQDDPAFVSASESRFHEESVQARTGDRLRNESLLVLKNSILTNGFLPFERIIVRPYDGDDDRFLVVEGNRRTAALQWIASDHEAGVDIREDLLESISAVPTIVLEDVDQALQLSMMGVRHVGGISEWGGYQRAKLITELRDEHGFETGEVGSRLGLSPHEVNRRYRAFKALRQMENDEEYGDSATARMYPLFHEAVALPVVREWLDWSEQESEFQSTEQREHFYDLITPRYDDEENELEPKISTFSDVRELRTILQVPEAKRALLDGSRSFHDAVGIAKADEISRSWATQVAEAVTALNSIGALELRNLSVEEVDEVKRLRDVAIAIINAYEVLTA